MSRVTAPDLGFFPCTLLPNRWNGFACPLFTREVGDEIMRELASGEDVVDAYYSSARDAFVILRAHDTEPEIFEATEGGLYGIGAFCWAWTEVPDTGCEECSWRGWAIFNRDPFGCPPQGQVQRCEECQSLAHDKDAYPLARQAGYEIDDDSGRVTKTPSCDLRRVVITFDVPAETPNEAWHFLRPLMDAFTTCHPVVEIFTLAEHERWLDESDNLGIRAAADEVHQPHHHDRREYRNPEAGDLR